MKIATLDKNGPILPTTSILLLCAVLYAFPAQAALHPEIALSSAGAGVAATVPLKKHNDLRLEYDFLDAGGYKLVTTTNETLNGSLGQPPVIAQMKFDDTFHLQNFSVLFDHHLNQDGPLYVSTGLTLDGNHINAVSRTDESSFQLSGNTYTGQTFGAVKIHIRWNSIVPYFGVGLQHQSASAQRKPRIELGVFAQGPRHISVETSGIVAENPALFGSYVAAFTARVPSHVPILGLYPVLRISLPVGR